MANGGIGVSYSNVVLAGGVDSRQNQGGYIPSQVSSQRN